MTDTTPPRPFDERAALQELERLADKIQLTRRQRQQSVAEFESFVKAFREDRYEQLIAAQAAELSAPAGPPEQKVPEPPRAQEAAATPIPALQPWEARPFPPSAGIAPRPKAPRARLALMALGGLALVLLVAWLWRGNATNTAPPASLTSVPTAAAPDRTPVQTPAPAPVASAGPPRALNVELITLRPVWTRVIVDGQKVIERELPKDSRIPLSADRAIAIRAGDAGAVRLMVAGKDMGVLGRDGQIGTRTLTAPPGTTR